MWGIRIPEEDSRTLSDLLPMHGAKTWLIETGLKAFLDLMAGSPAHRAWAKQQIIAHNRESKAVKMVEISFRVPSEQYFRFNHLFPEIGSGSWFVRTLVKSTVEYLKQAPTMEEQIGTVVNMAMTPGEPHA